MLIPNRTHEATTENVVNVSNTSAFDFVRGSGLGGGKNFVALFLLIIPMMTVFGNLLVVASVCRERALRTATNYLIISMAVADLLVALCVMPFAVYVEVQNGLWKLPKGLCTCYTAIDVFCSTASILNLVAISWDRYMAVSKPIEYAQSRSLKNRRVFAMILAVWCISVVIALPVATGLNRLDDTPYCEFTNAVYIIASSFASFFLPCFIMVVLYSVVMKKLRQRQEQRTRSNQNSRYSLKRRTLSKRSGLSLSFRTSAITSDRNTSNYDVSVVTRVSRFRDADDDCNVDFGATNVRLRFENAISNDELVTGSAFTQPPRIIISSAVPEPSSLCVRGSSQASNELRRKDQLQVEEERNGWSSRNSNNVIMATAAMDFCNRHDSYLVSNGLVADRNQQLKAPFDLLDVDESVPFIDATSVQQATPLRKQKLSSRSACCNGMLKLSVSSMSFASPLVRANSLSVLEQTSLSKPRLTSVIANTTIRQSSPSQRMIEDLNSRSITLTTPEPRRHSIANFTTGPSGLSVRFRDRSCFSEVLDLYRKKAASSSAAAALAAAKYSRQSGKERRATQTLAVVLVVFLCCWLPFFTCHMTNSVCMVLSGDTCINILAFFFTTWLGYMNSFMNPVIYTIFNPEYRRAFRNILCCRSSGRRR